MKHRNERTVLSIWRRAAVSWESEAKGSIPTAINTKAKNVERQAKYVEHFPFP